MLRRLRSRDAHRELGCSFYQQHKLSADAEATCRHVEEH
jgi:hypothetical protein